MGRASFVQVAAVVLCLAAPSYAKPPPHKPAPVKTTKTTKPAAQKPAAATATDEPAAPAPAPPPDTAVKAAGTKQEAPKTGNVAKVTATEESGNDKGVKTYKFSAVEVEGRLKSPQIVYFLRRVRAEFEAGDLGHRSFMPELSDTRRSASLK
ncbi:MAG TPA: hypothetical protein VGQ57_11390 [Polyangiaceae bacterium]|jgi:hypothetical protein|nr:hypothetical protein [Polyangiaceae bacterium]